MPRGRTPTPATNTCRRDPVLAQDGGQPQLFQIEEVTHAIENAFAVRRDQLRRGASSAAMPHRAPAAAAGHGEGFQQLQSGSPGKRSLLAGVESTCTYSRAPCFFNLASSKRSKESLSARTRMSRRRPRNTAEGCRNRQIRHRNRRDKLRGIVLGHRISGLHKRCCSYIPSLVEHFNLPEGWSGIISISANNSHPA